MRDARAERLGQNNLVAPNELPLAISVVGPAPRESVPTPYADVPPYSRRGFGGAEPGASADRPASDRKSNPPALPIATATKKSDETSPWANPPAPGAPNSAPRASPLALLPWIIVALAATWTVLLRLPLLLNAGSHLDSDLAVDGLTLLDATRGTWRWHYPATPDMGIFPLFLSLIPALVGGVNPISLDCGGAIASVALLVTCYVLARQTYGTSVALWGLIPLTFASTGAIWLSGRITGGHLLTAVWHAGLFLLVERWLVRGGSSYAAAVGLWSGLGISLDLMFVLSLVGAVPAGVVGWWSMGRSRRVALPGLICALAFGAGLVPRELGRRIDPYNAYGGQLAPSWDTKVLREHGVILAAKCLPRLVAGHQLPGLETDPDPRTLPIPMAVRTTRQAGWLALGTTVTALAGFAVAFTALLVVGGKGPPARLISAGLLISAAAVVGAFVVNRNIFNSDNYRYLVTLLVPWSAGFGLAFDWLARRGRKGMAVALLGGAAIALLFTADAAEWYRRLGWLDDRGLPFRRPLNDPALKWLDEHPEITTLYGSYWDVYRLAFLTNGRVRGVPFPEFPNRFPEWSLALPAGRPETLIVRRTPLDQRYYLQAMAEGGTLLHEAPGFRIIAWPGKSPPSARGFPHHSAPGDNQD